MGLETRGGSGLYFYKKKRDGDKVLSLYQGSGYLARIQHELDEFEREDARRTSELEIQALESQKAYLIETDAPVVAFCELVRNLQDAFFLINGHHKHSRSWRRRTWQEQRQKKR